VKERGEGEKEDVCVRVRYFCARAYATMGWLRLVGSLKLYVSFAKEPHKRDDILQKRPIFLRSLLIVATPCVSMNVCVCVCVCERECVRRFRARTYGTAYTVCECGREREKESERKREKARVRVCACVCVRARVSEREKE